VARRGATRRSEEKDDSRLGRVVFATTFETVRVTNIVAVLFVELVVCDGRKGLAPEDDRFLDRETDALRDEGGSATTVSREEEKASYRTLRNKLYCCLPSCLRCLLVRSVSWSDRMHIGKLCPANPGTISAVMASPSAVDEKV
jgi:hypothetical protein